MKTIEDLLTFLQLFEVFESLFMHLFLKINLFQNLYSLILQPFYVDLLM